MNLFVQQGILVEKSRISSIDIVRGLVMVVMALDHSRHYLDGDSLLYEPTDLDKTTTFLFLTRWITHFCAPSFVLLAGVAIRISMRRKSKRDLTTFLVSRGLWLIFLEMVIVRFAITFNWYFDFTLMQVIWALGAAMLLMALFIRMKETWILAVSLLIIFGHNLLQGISVDPSDPWYIPAVLLLVPGPIFFGESTMIMVSYPVLPWLGIMMLGYVVGRWFSHDYDVLRRAYLLNTGIAMILLFLVLRYSNFYGDPHPWAARESLSFTILSFLNCEKYPPSLLFTLMTLGPVFIALALLEKSKSSIWKPLEVFGRVPLFYYILHFVFLHFAGLFFFMYQTGTAWSDIDFHVIWPSQLGGINASIGHSMTAVYVAWLFVVLLLYPLCSWYNKLKSKGQGWWYSYI